MKQFKDGVTPVATDEDLDGLLIMARAADGSPIFVPVSAIVARAQDDGEGEPPEEEPLFPAEIAVPTSNQSAISLSQPSTTPVQFGSLDTKVRMVVDNTRRHVYATWWSWNADRTRLLLNFQSPYTLLDGDLNVLSTNAGEFGAAHCFFDPVDPDILWGHDGSGGGNRIWRYNYDTDTSQTFTFTGYTDAIIGGGEGSISHDGRYMAVALTHGGGANTDVAVFDTQAWAIDRILEFDGWDFGGDFDNCHISPSGDYVIVASYANNDEGHHVYSRATGSKLYVYDGGPGSTDFPGHAVTGYRSDGTECLIRQDENGAVVSVRLSDGSARVEMPAVAATWFMHFGVAPGRPGYVYFSAFYGGSGYLNRRLGALKLNGNQRCELFGDPMHHSSDDYGDQAHAMPSQDGQLVLFSSSWGGNARRAYICGVDL